MKKYNNTQTVILLLVILFVVFAGFYLVSRRNSTNPQSPMESNQPGLEKIDLSPATEEDRKAADQNKQENLDRTDLEAQPQPTTRTVTPVITDAGLYDGNIEVTGFIPGIIEDSGTCTITLSKGTSQVTRQSSSAKDATTTRCQNVIIPRTEFAQSGTWKVTISYASSTANGISAERSVEIN